MRYLCSIFVTLCLINCGMSNTNDSRKNNVFSPLMKDNSQSKGTNLISNNTALNALENITEQKLKTAVEPNGFSFNLSKFSSENENDTEPNNYSVYGVKNSSISSRFGKITGFLGLRKIIKENCKCRKQTNKFLRGFLKYTNKKPKCNYDLRPNIIREQDEPGNVFRKSKSDYSNNVRKHVESLFAPLRTPINSYSSFEVKPNPASLSKPHFKIQNQMSKTFEKIKHLRVDQPAVDKTSIELNKDKHSDLISDNEVRLNECKSHNLDSVFDQFIKKNTLKNSQRKNFLQANYLQNDMSNIIKNTRTGSKTGFHNTFRPQEMRDTQVNSFSDSMFGLRQQERIPQESNDFEQKSYSKTSQQENHGGVNVESSKITYVGPHNYTLDKKGVGKSKNKNDSITNGKLLTYLALFFNKTEISSLSDNEFEELIQTLVEYRNSLKQLKPVSEVQKETKASFNKLTQTNVEGDLTQVKEVCRGKCKAVDDLLKRIKMFKQHINSTYFD